MASVCHQFICWHRQFHASKLNSFFNSVSTLVSNQVHCRLHVSYFHIPEHKCCFVCITYHSQSLPSMIQHFAVALRNPYLGAKCNLFLAWAHRDVSMMKWREAHCGRLNKINWTKTADKHTRTHRYVVTGWALGILNASARGGQHEQQSTAVVERLWSTDSSAN